MNNAVNIMPPEIQTEGRDRKGRFAPGNGIGNRFQPGQSGNPAGRTTYGAYISTWINEMANWTEKEVRAVIKDKSASASKRTAARLVLSAMRDDIKFIRDKKTGELFPVGELQGPGKAFDRCCDRTSGKPHQTQTIEHKSVRSAHDLLNEARRKLGINKITEPMEPSDN